MQIAGTSIWLFWDGLCRSHCSSGKE